MPTLEEGRAILIDTVVKKKTHKHYKHVTELADLYKKLITGDKINQLLKQFTRREDAELFKQRELLTQAITPAVSSSLMNPFYKVGRSNSIIKELYFETNEDNDKRLQDIKEAMRTYNGTRNVDDYLEIRYVDLNFTDPNSFIITEFDPAPVGDRGEMVEKVKPRPFECSSHEAINFFYKNNILQWLIVKLPITYKSADGKYEEGFSYTIYLENEAVKLTQVDNTFVSLSDGEYGDFSFSTPEGIVEREFYRVSENELYMVEEFEHKAEEVPAERVGYKLDLVTNGQTFVSPMHDALCYFMKSIKTVSEFDLTMALHAFPQKFQYVNRCKAEGCNDGVGPEGNMCKACQGTGWAVHSTTQDAVSIRMPKNKDDMFPLEQMVHYESPPIDILKFQNDFIKQLKNEARQAVFNSEIFNKEQMANPETATQVKISLESVYDTLFPFAQAFSQMYIKIVTLIAKFRDQKDVIVGHKFPKDFKFKTVADLLVDQKVANDSNAPGYIKNQISLDIAEQMFIDKPQEFRKILTKQKFFPFPDKNQQEVIYLVSNNLTTEYNKVLWANFDQIFMEVEQDAELENKNFYDYAYKLQKEKIEAKVKEMLSGISSSQPEAAVDFRTANSQDSEQPGQTTNE